MKLVKDHTAEGKLMNRLEELMNFALDVQLKNVQTHVTRIHLVLVLTFMRGLPKLAGCIMILSKSL
jgi:alkylhydroperoxidase/carboxymuconolactone decarboxylase family protein YurZ